MTWIKQHWQIVIICILTCFSLSKCTQSCNRLIQSDKINSEYLSYKNLNDSINKIYVDSIKTLNNELILKDTKIEMLETTLKDLKVSTDALTKVNDNLSKRNTQVIIKQEQVKEN